MRQSAVFLVSVVFFLSGTEYSYAAGNSSGSVRLQDLVALARSKSESLKAAELSAKAEEIAAIAVHKSALPKLRFESSHGPVLTLLNQEMAPNQNQTPALRSSNFISTFSLGSNWVLYDWGERSHQENLAEISSRMAKLKVESQNLDLSRRIAQQYFQVQSVLAQIEINQAVEKTMQSQFARADRRFRQGLLPRQEYQRISAELKRIQVEKDSRGRVVQNLLLKLARTIGVDFDALNSLGRIERPKFPKNSQEFDAKMADAVYAKNIADELDDAALLVARLNVERGRHKRIAPEISFSVNGSYGADGYVNSGSDLRDRDRAQVSAVLSVNMDLWDWGVQRLNNEAEWEKYRALDMSLDGGRQERRLEFDMAKNNLRDQLNHYDLVKELLDAEEGNFENLEQDIRQGRASNLDLITSLRDLTSSRRQLNEAYFAIQNQMIDVKYYEGRLDEWIKNH